jgi:uncharacterized membrane protein YeiH
VLRDILIDRRPFFFVEHQGVLLAVLILSAGSAILVGRRGLESGERWLRIPDAIGLGLFSATGVHLSWMAGQPPLVAILMGVITGSFGGVLRDLICNEIPTLFRDHRPYAICAAAGGGDLRRRHAAPRPRGRRDRRLRPCHHGPSHPRLAARLAAAADRAGLTTDDRA